MNITLEDIFEKFNPNRPEDFKGHLLSVSDITIREALDETMEAHKPNVVEIFKQKTLDCFHPINDMTVEDIEETVYAYVQAVLDDVCPGAKVLNVALSGSRCRGLERYYSDIDVVVEYEGEIREDVLFNYLHEEDFSLCGLNVDIDPITGAKTGTLETYLRSAEIYLSEKAK